MEDTDGGLKDKGEARSIQPQHPQEQSTWHATIGMVMVPISLLWMLWLDFIIASMNLLLQMKC